MEEVLGGEKYILDWLDMILFIQVYERFMGDNLQVVIDG